MFGDGGGGGFVWSCTVFHKEIFTRLCSLLDDKGRESREKESKEMKNGVSWCEVDIGGQKDQQTDIEMELNGSALMHFLSSGQGHVLGLDSALHL